MNSLTEFVDRYLNHITMYRLVLYYCAALLAGDFALGLFGLAQHDPAQLAFSTLVICAVAWVVDGHRARYPLALAQGGRFDLRAA